MAALSLFGSLGPLIFAIFFEQGFSGLYEKSLTVFVIRESPSSG